MKPGSIVLVALLATLCKTALATPPPDCFSKLAVSGTWQPLPTADNETATWEILPDRIRLNIPPKSAGDCSITCSEPVPDGDWTMDIWTVLHFPGGYHGSEVTISIGKNGEGPYLSMKFGMSDNRGSVFLIRGDERGSSYSLGKDNYVRSGGGPIAWIRISHSKRTGRVKIRMNGQLASATDAAATVPSASPVIKFKTYPKDVPSVFEIVSYQMTPDFEPDTYSPGAAFEGWQEPLASEGLKSISDLHARLQKMLADPRLTPPGRAYVLATEILAEKASAGKVSAESWKRAADFVQATGATDPVAVLCILPIAAACGDQTQCSEVKAWSDRYKDLPVPDWRKMGDKHRNLQRISLVDPVLAADISMAEGKNLSLRLFRSISAQLMKTDPAYALALNVFTVGHDSFKTPRLAWMLPELQAVCPTYYRLAAQHLCERADDQKPVKEDHNHAFSYGAYRLASVDPPMAMGLFSMIKDPGIKAETLQYMSEVFSASQATEMDKTVEVELKESIRTWAASRSEPSPSERYVRLAKWYQSRGRTDEAVALMRECTGKLGETAGARFRSARDIAKMLFSLKLPEADGWTKKAAEFAVAADAEGSDSGEGIYITATYLMVTDLLAQDRFEDALRLANQDDSGGTSREMMLTHLIQYIAKTDMPRALEMLEGYPQAVSRSSLVANLIRTMGGKDPDKAKSLFETIGPERQVEMAFRIGDALPAEVMTQVCTQALADSFRQEYHFGEFAARPLDEWLSGIDLATLFSFESMFSEDYDRFAHQVLANVAQKCGLEWDWMWQCYYGPRLASSSGMIPGGGGELRYSIKAEAEQAAGRF